MSRFAYIAVLLVCAACATPIPFNVVSLGGEPTVNSNKRAALSHVSGTVESRSSMGFGAKDQAEFIDVLRAELVRLKVFRAVTIGDTMDNIDLKIAVVFSRTTHQRYSRLFYWDPGYELDVVMKIEGGKAMLQQHYLLNSSEGLSVWQQLNITPYESKVRAVRQLLEKLVPDIQAYVAKNAEP